MASIKNLKQNLSRSIFLKDKKTCLKQFYADVTSSKELKACHAFTSYIASKT